MAGCKPPKRHARAQGWARGKTIAPQAKRLSIEKAIEEHGLSERHACRLVGLTRDSYRHPPQSTLEDARRHHRLDADASPIWLPTYP
jgi:hypothetical protein